MSLAETNRAVDQKLELCEGSTPLVLVQTVRNAFLGWEFNCLRRSNRPAGTPLFATFTYSPVPET